MNKTIDNINEFSHEVASLMNFWGFTHGQGLLWAKIYFSDDISCFREISQELQRNISTVLQDLSKLVQYGFINEETCKESRIKKYKPNPKALQMILAVVRQKELTMIEQLESTYNSLKTLPLDVRTQAQLTSERLQKMEEKISVAKKQLQMVLKLGHLDIRKSNFAF